MAIEREEPFIVFVFAPQHHFQSDPIKIESKVQPCKGPGYNSANEDKIMDNGARLHPNLIETGFISKYVKSEGIS